MTSYNSMHLDKVQVRPKSQRNGSIGRLGLTTTYLNRTDATIIVKDCRGIAIMCPPDPGLTGGEFPSGNLYIQLRYENVTGCDDIFHQDGSQMALNHALSNEWAAESKAIHYSKHNELSQIAIVPLDRLVRFGGQYIEELDLYVELANAPKPRRHPRTFQGGEYLLYDGRDAQALVNSMPVNLRYVDNSPAAVRKGLDYRYVSMFGDVVCVQVIQDPTVESGVYVSSTSYTVDDTDVAVSETRHYPLDSPQVTNWFFPDYGEALSKSNVETIYQEVAGKLKLAEVEEDRRLELELRQAKIAKEEADRLNIQLKSERDQSREEVRMRHEDITRAANNKHREEMSKMELAKHELVQSLAAEKARADERIAKLRADQMELEKKHKELQMQHELELAKQKATAEEKSLKLRNQRDTVALISGLVAAAATIFAVVSRFWKPA